MGVAPPGFAFPGETLDVWLPVGWQRTAVQELWFRRAHFLSVIARLEEGATPEAANAQLQVVVQRLQRDYPDTNRVMGAGLTPLQEFLVGDARAPLLILLGATALLLLLACANVANLLLVRAAGRAREIALRAALGAALRPGDDGGKAPGALPAAGGGATLDRPARAVADAGPVACARGLHAVLAEHARERWWPACTAFRCRRRPLLFSGRLR